MAKTMPTSTPVSIIGGGPVGLVSSILLSLKGIDHVLLERQPGTSIHPKAVGLNQRTIEIFCQLGVEDEVLRQSAPVSSSGSTAWFTSFGPNGRKIARRDAWGGGQYADKYAHASPCRYVLLPQIRLEPILRRRAEELNPTGIFYNHEVKMVTEDGQTAKLIVEDRTTGNTTQVSSTYALGCDGGRFLSDALGIGQTGESNIVDMVTAHFRAPLSQHHDTNHFLSWFINPELGGSLKTGYLYHLGPYPIQPETEEWVFACARLLHEQEKPFTEDDMLHRIQRTLGVPDLSINLSSMSHWRVNAKVASRYRSTGGRIFLVGDAAHRVPPWGALGLNSGIQDAQNLVWKLALAIRDPQTDYNTLLDSYDDERRPIGERVAKTSLQNMRAHALVLDQALGLAPERTMAENEEAMNQFFDLQNQEAGKAKRDAVEKALETLDLEFYAHGAEVGWIYDIPSSIYGQTGPIPSPQQQSNGEMEVCEYHACGSPGYQLPHVWLSDQHGKRKSSRELVGQHRLLLLAPFDSWLAFQHPLVDVHIVNGSDGGWRDADGEWLRQMQLPASGALLVRPDNIIAYRFDDGAILEASDSSRQRNEVVCRVLELASANRWSGASQTSQ